VVSKKFVIEMNTLNPRGTHPYYALENSRYYISMGYLCGYK
jgi:hypothetical protein